MRAVCTQIAQISLDISAGQMVSEIAPPADFIQRCGRVGFRGQDPKGVLTDVFFYMPETNRPCKEDLEGLLPWYATLVNRPSWSFHDLVEHFQGNLVEAPLEDPYARSMLISRPMLTRTSDGKVTALLEQDLPEIKQLLDIEHDGRLIQQFEFTTYPRKSVSETLFAGRAVYDFAYDPRLGVMEK